MAGKSTHDLLERARVFHRQLSEFYDKLSEKAGRERVKLLLQYMSRHETQLEESLQKYEHSTGRTVLNAWLKNIPDYATCRCFEKVELKQDMSLDEVVAMALRLDDCLLRMYKTVADTASSKEVRDLFQELHDMARRDEHQLVRDAVEMEEV